jgi:MFS family permease
MRFLIGICEAGLIPGSIFLLSAYYPRYELQWRVNMLMVGNAISSAVGGLLALGISNIHASNGYKGWRWIFIIEGCMTVGVTVAAFPFMRNWPESQTWLSNDERAVLQERIRSDGMVGKMDRLDSRALKRILLDWKIWVCASMFICSIVAVYR